MLICTVDGIGKLWVVARHFPDICFKELGKVYLNLVRLWISHSRVVEDSSFWDVMLCWFGNSY